jgi:hypothetical protein
MFIFYRRRIGVAAKDHSQDPKRSPAALKDAGAVSGRRETGNPNAAVYRCDYLPKT